MANVIFRHGTKAQYDALPERDGNALYWLSDVQEIRKGDLLFGKGAEASADTAGLMSAADKQKLDELSGGTVAALKAVDASIIMANEENGERTIRVGISTDSGNILSIRENGLFAADEGTSEALSAVQDSIDVLNGTGEGSVQKKAEDAAAAAINDFASKVSDDGVVNTMKELVDYVAAHGQEAADMAADITAAQGVIGSLPDKLISGLTAVSKTEISNTVEFLCSVKQGDGTYAAGENIIVAFNAAASDAAGLMSAADKQKLDAISLDAIAAIENSLVWGNI